MRRVAVARRISRKNISRPRKNATMAAMNNNATVVAVSTWRNAPKNNTAITAQMSNAVIVQRVMERPMSLALRASVESSDITSLSAPVPQKDGSDGQLNDVRDCSDASVLLHTALKSARAA